MKRWAASCLFLFSILGCNKLLSHTVGPEPLVDADYQFRLAAPGPGWKLLPQKEIRRLVPDSVAGAAESGHGVADRHGAVIVEVYSGDKPRELAELLLGNMTLEDKKTVSMVDVEFEKKPAVRYQVTGKINGIDVRYVNVVFFHQSHAYQVLAWGLAEQVDEKALLAFANSFHLTDGPVRDRSNLRKVEDERGVGWQVKGGVFQSAADGLTLRAAEGWQLAIGDELQRMNSSAEVGLVHGNPEAYLVVVAEPRNGISKEEYIKICLDHNVTALGAEPVAGPPWKAEVAGQTVQFNRYRHKKLPMEYLLGVAFHGDTAFLLMNWYEVGFSEKGPALLQASVSGVGFMEEPAQKALRRELNALPDVQAGVGPTYSLRRGLYRNFEHGVTWRMPPSALRLAVGQEARKHNEDATLFFEELETGLYGLLIAEPTQADGETYHKTVTHDLIASSVGGGRRLRPSATVLGKLPGLVTVVDRKLEGMLLTQELVTAVAGGRAYQVLLWGQPAAMKSGGAWLQAVLSGFTFGALVPLLWEGETLTDQRLGFAFQPPAALGADWQHNDITPKEIRPLGTMMEWKNSRYSVSVIAIHALESGQDEDWFLEQIRQSLPGRLSLLSSEHMSEDRLGGEAARRVSMKRLGQLHGELVVLRRDRTFYALSVDAASGSLDPSATNSIKAGFRFVD